MNVETKELHPCTDLSADEEIWRQTNIAPEDRAKILSLIAEGRPALSCEDLALPATFAGNSVFRKKNIGTGAWLVPQRFERMVEFFLRRRQAGLKETGNAAITELLGEDHNCLLTGGPGTGKSYQIAALVNHLALQQRERPLRITIAAPTGKAVARFAHLTTVSGVILEWSTIHRLLGLSGELSEPRFHARNPLGVDLLVVDEISMLDLGLFTWLIDALPDHARVVLAGDLGQLPAVDGMPIDHCLAFLEHCNLVTRVHLTQVHRFSESRAATYHRIAASGLAAIEGSSEGVSLVQVKNAAEARSLLARLAAERFGSERAHYLRQRLAAEFSPGAAVELVREVFAWQKEKIILTTRREGLLGSESLNKLIAARLSELLPERTLTPLIITANNYRLGVFNGDTGFIAYSNGREFAVLEASEGTIVCIPLAELTGWQLAFAVTVHKSQGSEYGEVLLVFEEKAGEIKADHRLLYTAVTRAREHAQVLQLPATGRNP